MSAKPLLIIALLALAGCHTSEEGAQSREQMNQLRLHAWQACIDSGGAPVEGWLGAPQMNRCEYPVKP